MARVFKLFPVAWMLCSLCVVPLGCGDDQGSVSTSDRDDAGSQTGGRGGRGGTGGRSGTGGAGSGGRSGSGGQGGGDAGAPASCDDLDCEAPATCDDSGSAPRCVCPDGYDDSQGDGSQCDDIDECADADLNDCAAQAVCTNTEGAFECACPEPAYTGDGQSCDCAVGYTDVDGECLAEDGTDCDENGECENGHCVSGVCCASACDAPESCATSDGASCEDGATCVYPDAADGTDCEDDDPCTDGDQCSGGSCEPGGPKDCSGVADACNTAMCEASTGNCIPVPTNQGGTCDDGNPCTENDQCNAGDCSPGTLKNCTSEDNACNVGVCNTGNGQCQPMPTNNGGACSDGNACTPNDQCSAGTCVGSGTLDCDDDNLCTTDSCVPATGCNNQSTGIDCSGLTNQCNTGACNPDTGACRAVPNTGVVCDDGNACTVGETCSAAGACGGSTPRMCDDANPCTDDSCSPQLGCQVQNNTDACSDNDPCTTNDHCLAGACTDTDPVDCSSLNNQCNVGVCNPGTGACAAQPANGGNACTDGNSCTATDVCTNGTCTGSGNACGPNATGCTQGNPNTCTCQPNYVDNGAGQCVPITDECDLDPCSPNATCLDPSSAPGNVTCTCNTGYTGNGFGPNGCTDIDECQGNPCGAGRGTCMQGAPGTYTCNCNAAYMQVNGTCVCDLNGTFAIRIAIETSWSNIDYIEDGSGVSYSWAIRNHSYLPDGTLEVETINCNATAPDLCGTGIPPFLQLPALPPEAYAQITTNQFWGLPSMPVDLSSDSLPNALPMQPFVTDPVASLLGIHLDNPFGQWPGSRGQVGSGPGPAAGVNGSYWQNHDGDSNIAVTSHVIPPGGMIDNDSIPDPVVDYPATSSDCGLPYRWVPAVEYPNYRHVKRVYTASRVISEMSGTIQSCDLITGNVTGPANGDIQSDLRFYGCTRCANGESSATCADADCSNSIANTFDNTSTAGTTIDSATFRIQRIDLSAATDDVQACEIVRDQLCFAPGVCN